MEAEIAKSFLLKTCYTCIYNSSLSKRTCKFRWKNCATNDYDDIMDFIDDWPDSETCDNYEQILNIDNILKR